MGDADPDANSNGCEGEWGHWEYGKRETLRYDPDGRCGRTRQSGTYWASESPLLRMASGPSNRVDELRAIGNVGCPPVSYARAYIVLADALYRSNIQD